MHSQRISFIPGAGLILLEELMKSAKDPLAKLLVGNLLLLDPKVDSKSFHAAYKLMEEGHSLCKDSKYSSFTKFIASFWLYKSTDKSRTMSAKKQRSLRIGRLDSFIKYLIGENEACESRLKYSFAINQLMKFPDPKVNDIFNQKLQSQKDKIDPWLFEMIAGSYIYVKASLNQPKDHSRHFEYSKKYMKACAQYFRKAYQLNPDRPEAAMKMISCAYFTGESAREWFAKSIKAEFDYPIAYKAYIG